MKISRPLLTSATALTLAFGFAACGSDAGSGSASPSPDNSAPTDVPASDVAGDSAAEGDAAAVGIKNSRFDPTELKVAVGDTVTFTNNDPFAHTVTSKDDSAISFDSDTFSDGETFAVEFTEAGTFDYFCQIHPTMRASIVVG